MEADSMTQKQLVQNLDSLKASFDNNLNRVVQSVKSSNENFDAKINTLTQHVTGVKEEIIALKNLLEEEKKQKTLERALTMTDLESFEYYDYDANSNRKASAELAKKAIKWFMLGYGLNFSSCCTTPSGSYQRDLAKEQEFREKFKAQIKTLIQREPRIVQKNDGSFAIFYK